MYHKNVFILYLLYNKQTLFRWNYILKTILHYHLTKFNLSKNMINLIYYFINRFNEYMEHKLIYFLITCINYWVSLNPPTSLTFHTFWLKITPLIEAVIVNFLLLFELRPITFKGICFPKKLFLGRF